MDQPTSELGEAVVVLENHRPPLRSRMYGESQRPSDGSRRGLLGYDRGPGMVSYSDWLHGVGRKPQGGDQ